MTLRAKTHDTVRHVLFSLQKKVLASSGYWLQSADRHKLKRSAEHPLGNTALTNNLSETSKDGKHVTQQAININ
jgi:hypothetical protein